MIKAIIFDLGNVIYNFDNNLFLNKISKHTEHSAAELNELIYESSTLPKQYETGLLTSDEFFDSITDLCDLSISKNDFIEAYTNIYTPIAPTFDLIRNLRPNYKLALLSNTCEWDIEYGIKPRMGELFDAFDAVSLSFEIKAMKPREEIFLDVLEKLKLRPEECIYIDDIKEYTDAASKLGINGVHYTSHTELIADLARLGVHT